MIKIFAPFLSRTFGLIFAAIVLSGCIEGGSGSLQIANGVGGTGISTGRITAFGSIYVNGIKFETDQANFIRNGVDNKTQADFNAGERVSVKGTLNSDGKTGVATTIIYDSLLVGLVTSLSETNVLKVGDTSVEINTLTVMHGFKDLSELSPSDVLDVSGFLSEGVIIASSLRRLTEGETFTLYGKIEGLDTDQKQFTLSGSDNHIVDYSQLPTIDLVDNTYVKISTQMPINNKRIIAFDIESIEGSTHNVINVGSSSNRLLSTEEGDFYKQEGFVTNYLGNQLILGNDMALVDDTTQYVNGSAADLTTGKLVRIEGYFNDSAMMVATTITLLDVALESEVEATITELSQEQSLVTLLGTTYTVDNFTLFFDETDQANKQINLSHFAVGDRVRLNIKARTDQSSEVIRLTKITDTGIIKMVSQATAKQSDIGKLTVLGVKVTTFVSTQYYDENDLSITPTEFFNRVVLEGTSIEVTGITIASDGKELLATILKLR